MILITAISVLFSKFSFVYLAAGDVFGILIPTYCRMRIFNALLTEKYTHIATAYYLFYVHILIDVTSLTDNVQMRSM